MFFGVFIMLPVNISFIYNQQEIWLLVGCYEQTTVLVREILYHNMQNFSSRLNNNYYDAN